MGNAYDNASLIVTPNAYKASKIYALKPTDGSGDLAFSRAGSKMRRNSAGLWETIGTNIPPLHYPVGGGCPSWLFEPEDTNSLLYSTDFSNAVWIVNGTATKTPSALPTNIVGVTPYDIAGLTTGANYLLQTKAGQANVYYRVFIRATEIADVGKTIWLTGNGTIAVNIILTNDWQEYITFDTGSNNQFMIRAGNSGTSATKCTISYAGVHTANASSPIITAGSSVTRLRDVPTGTMIAGTLGYTIVTNVNSLTTTAAIRNFLDLSNGSGRQGILSKSAANKLIFQVYLNGSLVNTVTSTNDLPSGMGKCAVVFNGTTYKIFMDGGIEGTLSAVGGFPNAYGFNDAASSIEQKDLEYYNVALSDSEIVDLITA